MKFNDTLEFLNLSYKKEITKIIFLTIFLVSLNVVMFMFVKQTFINILVVLGSCVFIYMFISRYSSMKTSIYQKREDEYLKIISYFKIFITNNYNVYQAFESLLPYCSDFLKEEVETLLKNIDEDKSVQPFINFSKSFDNILIENINLAIYQMIEEGENPNNLSHFSLIYDDIAKANQDALEAKKEKSLDSMNMFPLVGAGYITIVLVFGVFTVIGDLMNVI